MKAIRFSEDEYAALLKRNARVEGGWPFASDPATHKYHAQATEGYASKREAQRANELKLLEKSGAISYLREQVRFVLIPAQYGKDGALIERQCAYVADFVFQQDGATIVEDTKGYQKGTAWELYVVKRKLMLSVHGIRIRETGRA